MSDLRSVAVDLKWEWRRLRRRRLAAVSEHLLLGLGLGLACAAYVVFRGVVLSPLPFDSPSSLVRAWVSSSGHAAGPSFASWPDVSDWIASGIFSGLAAVDIEDLAMRGGKQPREIHAAAVSTGFFSLFHLNPAVGRFWTAEDQAGGSRLAVLSYRSWEVDFGADPGIIGRSINLEDEPYRISGVAPADFVFPISATHVSVYVSLAANGSGRGGPTAMRDLRYLSVFGRLRPGTSIQQTAAELSAVARRLAEQAPATNKGLVFGHVVTLHDFIVGQTSPSLTLLLYAAFLVAFVGVESAFGVRWAELRATRRDAGICTTLGETSGCRRRRIFLDAIVVGLPAGLVAVAAAAAAVATVRTSGLPVPRLGELRFPGDQALLLMGISVACAWAVAVAFSAASRYPVHADLGQPVRLIVATAVAAALLVVCVASLSGYRLLTADGPTFVVAGLVETSVDLPEQWTLAQEDDFYKGAILALDKIPGIQGVAVASGLPFSGGATLLRVSVAGHDGGPSVTAEVHVISSNYFTVLGYRPVATWPPSGALVTRALAVQLGTLSQHGYDIDVHMQGSGDSQEWHVVGEAPPVWDPNHAPGHARAILYLPLSQRLLGQMRILARTSPGREPYVLAAIGRVVPRLAAGRPSYDERVMSDDLWRLLAPAAFQLKLMAALAASSMALACAGIWASVMQHANERRREWAIRAAIGEPPLRRFAAAAGRSALWGAAGGIVGALFGLLGGRILWLRLGLSGGPPNFRSAILVAAISTALVVTATMQPAIRAVRRCPADELRND